SAEGRVWRQQCPKIVASRKPSSGMTAGRTHFLPEPHYPHGLLSRGKSAKGLNYVYDLEMGGRDARGVAGGGSVPLHRDLGGLCGHRAHPLLHLHCSVRGPAGTRTHRVPNGSWSLVGSVVRREFRASSTCDGTQSLPDELGQQV